MKLNYTVRMKLTLTMARLSGILSLSALFREQREKLKKKTKFLRVIVSVTYSSSVSVTIYYYYGCCCCCCLSLSFVSTSSCPFLRGANGVSGMWIE